MFTAFKLWFHIFYWFFITRNRSGRWVFPTASIPMARVRLPRDTAKSIYQELIRSDRYLRHRAQRLNDWSMIVRLTLAYDCVWIHFYPLHPILDFPMSPEDERWITYVSNNEWKVPERTTSFLVDPESAEPHRDVAQWNTSRTVHGWYEPDECLAVFKVTPPSGNPHDVIAFRNDHPVLYQNLQSKPTV